MLRLDPDVDVVTSVESLPVGLDVDSGVEGIMVLHALYRDGVL
jgi:hypothetical protein